MRLNLSSQADLANEASIEKEPLESFSDSAKIGVPFRNKIEIKSYRHAEGSTVERLEGSIVEIKFYARTKEKGWKLKQSFEFDKNSLIDCDPQIVDFNNDGFKDVTYISNVAARGANEVRTLFIYNKTRDELVHIKNSEDYPNMEYNNRLNCIDAWLFHGATTTVFLKLEGHVLKEFARVDTGLDRVVTLVDRNGKERIVRRDKMKAADIFTRYATFDPPR